MADDLRAITKTYDFTLYTMPGAYRHGRTELTTITQRIAAWIGHAGNGYVSAADGHARHGRLQTGHDVRTRVLRGGSWNNNNPENTGMDVT